MMGNFRYSIIIPHYNIPHLLRRCLSSIPKRDDIQVIVVDDSSPDAAIKELAQLESDFSHATFVYSKMNGGGGKARNIGLQHAEGKYVLFADADDFFNYCINNILDQYRESDCDIVYFNASVVDTETYLPTKRRSTFQKAVKAYEKSRDLRVFQYIFGEPWCKLVKRELIEANHVRFDEIPIHNDTKYSYMVGYYAKNIKFDKIKIPSMQKASWYF